MKWILWRIFLNMMRKKSEVTVIKTFDREFYFLAIARDADVDIEKLDKWSRELYEENGILLKIITTNYIDGIKFL